MIPTMRSCTLLALACVLASCGDSNKDSAKSTSAANSEILKGTISDDMIHYDTLRSRPPPAKIAQDEAAPPDAGASQAPDTGEAETATEAGGGASEAAETPEPQPTAITTPAADDE